MTTNTTWMNNVTSPIDIVTHINNSTAGGFILGLLATLGIIAIMSFRAQGKDFDEIFIFVGTAEFILIALSIAAQWIGFYWLMLPTAMIFAGIMVKVFAN